jgi:membrane-associated phospholipid phosphatase
MCLILAPNFVTNALVPLQNCAALAVGNPFSGVDHGLANWFHAHLTRTFVSVLRDFTELGASEWITVVLSVLVLFFIWKRWWASLVTLIIVVPGGMLLNELLKLVVHRHRPFVDGWFVNWSGYSFASGHTIGATLLYGQLALFVLPSIKSRRWRALILSTAVLFVTLVGFSRIALGAHYFTDVLGAIVLGISWLMLCLVATKPVRYRRAAVPDILAEVPAPVLVPVEPTKPPTPALLE